VSKPFSLQTLLDLSQLRLEDASRQLGKLMASEQEASRRLELLIQYRGEYHARFLAAAKDGLSRAQWRNFETFLGRLDVAIAQARHDDQARKQHTAAGQKAWLAQRGRVDAFDTLAQRHQAREVQQEQKREQKVQDEHAARHWQEDTTG